MLTDAPPRKASRAGFLESDRIGTLDLPQNGHLLTIAKSIESAMQAGRSADARRACAEFLAATSGFYRSRLAPSACLPPAPCESAKTGRPNCSGTTTPFVITFPTHNR